MATKEEKQQRKALRREMARQEQANAEANMPVSKTDLKELFNHLDERLTESSCDETLRYTREFLSNRSSPEEQVVSWLGQYGGFCDCEVLANVENEWGEIVGST